MTAAELALALVRTTLATGVAACLTMLLLSSLRVASPRIHRLAWSLVVLQGWLLVPWTFQLESPPVERVAPIVGGVSDADSVFQLNPPSASELPPAIPVGEATPSFASLALLAWLTGAALAAILVAARYARIARVLPFGAAPSDVEWQAEWRDQLAASRIRQKVDLRITDRLGPLLAYIPFTYLILAPRPLWTALTSAERTAILCHELAHLRRCDLWKSLALRALALPQWFNPLVWLAVRRFDEAAEWACDESAARGLARDLNAPLTLANALLRTAELCTAQAASSQAAATVRAPSNFGIPAVSNGRSARNRTQLSRRIHRLVTPRFKEESTMRKLAVPALLAALAAAQLIRIERVAAENPPPSQGGARGGIPDDGLTSPPAATRREYKESAWPRYIVEPPDILAIEAVKLVPKAPHRLEAFDAVIVRVVGAFPEQPIDDAYSVDADGSINLGPTYGCIRVAGLTIEEAEEHIRADLAKILTDVKASASLVASAGAQQITGQHLVAMDGRVNLGVYGSVYVAGLTIEEAREAIERKLAEKLEQPQVSVDVLAYNSKVYYVITKGGAKGDDVVRAPITGNETVLDAIANLGGVSVDPATKIWIARPAPNGGKETILPVNWSEIARGAEPATNYQLMPGDRLFIEPPMPATPAEPVVEAPAGNLGANATEAANADAAPAPEAPTPPPGTMPRPGEAKQIMFKISVIQDRAGDIAQLSGDLHESGSMRSDSTTMLGALGIFAKHGLVKTLAEPTIVTTVGRPASFEVTGDDGERSMNLVIQPKSIGRDAEGRTVAVEIGMRKVEEGVDRGVVLHAGETFVFAARQPHPPHDKLGAGETYIVLTPEFVP